MVWATRDFWRYARAAANLAGVQFVFGAWMLSDSGHVISAHWRQAHHD